MFAIYRNVFPVNAKAKASCVTLGTNVVCGRQMSPNPYPVGGTYAESKSEVPFPDYVFYVVDLVLA